MKLIELDPKFITYHNDNGTIYHHYIDTIEQAQGIIFLCPKCFKTNDGKIGTHSIICWSSSKGVPDEAFPRPGRWMLVGSNLNDLTLNEEPNKSRSIALLSGCMWHGYITNGEVTDV